jgi:lipid-A-disaccharide synthase-like uncharacterized protein
MRLKQTHYILHLHYSSMRPTLLFHSVKCQTNLLVKGREQIIYVSLYYCDNSIAINLIDEAADTVTVSFGCSIMSIFGHLYIIQWLLCLIALYPTQLSCCFNIYIVLKSILYLKYVLNIKIPPFKIDAQNILSTS